MTTANLALLVQMEAKPEKADELEALLSGAVELAKQEAETLSWYAVKISDTRFAIFDTFAEESGRQAHLNGKIAEALLSRVDELLVGAPTIESVSVLAATRR